MSSFQAGTGSGITKNTRKITNLMHCISMTHAQQLTGAANYYTLRHIVTVFVTIKATNHAMIYIFPGTRPLQKLSTTVKL